MDFSRLFPEHQVRKYNNTMPPPPPPDPPPSSTGIEMHDQQNQMSPKDETKKLIHFLNEALSPKKPSRSLDVHQIRFVLKQVESIDHLLKQDNGQEFHSKNSFDLILQ
ncbi:hypothetical protein O181_021052 [Austropuccinia psidii MF-1]|uniref:Uncharacterized protein n=1 Tax=Austropuccinia psidii MF-1 TaxID=1389203 RepID=A0A9Q3CER1_9BASI|nr:hypothetical protein [Austropuccinia psidii MF-1]